MIKRYKTYWVATFLALIFIIAGIVTISDYGMSWDAAFRMMRGQAYAQLYLNGKLNYGFSSKISPVIINPGDSVSRYHSSAWETDNGKPNLPARPIPQADFKNFETKNKLRTSFYQTDAWNGNYFLHEETGHLPLIDTLAAFSNRLFHSALGILGDIESYQLIYILASAIGIFVVTAFTYQITESQIAAAIAGISLGLFPLFLGDSHINMKDPVQASFYAGSIWGFWNWIRTNRLRWFGVFGAFIALALGVKWQVGFLPLVFIPWLFFIRKTPEFKHWFKLKKLLILFTLLLVSCILFMIVIFPDSWSNPAGKLIEVGQFYLGVGTGGDNSSLQPDGFYGPLGINLYPIALFLTQTPEIILFLIIVSLFSGVNNWNKDHLKSFLLILLWAFEPLLRLTSPHVRDLLGLRQIMEFIPGLAVLAGLGVWYLLKTTKSKLQIPNNFQFSNPKTWILEFICILVLVIWLLIPVISFHPNEHDYFNSLAGGLNGAEKEKLVDWTLTYGNVYKEAAMWLDKNSEPNANLALLAGTEYGISPLWLRDDISFSPYHFSALDQKGEYFFVLYTPDIQPDFAIEFPQKFLKPIHQIMVDGAPVLSIYKNSPEFLKDGYKSETKVNNATIQAGTIFDQKVFELNLQKNVGITRVIISGANPECLNSPINDIFIFEEATQVANKQVDPRQVYPFSEAKFMDNGNLEFFFPAPKSQYLTIVPGQQNSCFANAKFKEVDSLSD
jgi:uncharacterized membrane protein